MDCSVKVAQITFYLGYFIVLVMSSNNVNEAEENFIDDLPSDEICSICQQKYEETPVFFNVCKHKFCNYCANKITYFQKIPYKCPVCRNQNLNFIDIKPDTRNLCYICENEPMSVKLRCGHMLGNSCAYRDCYVLMTRKCLYCDEENWYQNLLEPDTKLTKAKICMCKSERVTHVLKPCKHRIGTICSTFVEHKLFYCPHCFKRIENVKPIDEFKKDEKNERIRILKKFLCMAQEEIIE
ncbi:uncharacterized protein LOC126896391 isoform X2 [Daktulosphaira vitifoliae]|uniref:uncharacterized protein LOC126896391 isoform X2 n=1 Tax=Daktulosphaira vitifoliae TaxID=58002 RepID=UPI0021AA0603|nr:uncharacterized protein LOC126896391 isoform X2 [Daktulosphaira vitifoliae]